MLKLILFLSICLTMNQVQAVQFACQGEDKYHPSHQEVQLHLVFKDDSKKLNLRQESSSDELSLEHDQDLQLQNQLIYADWSYDGYGGYISVIVPQEMTLQRNKQVTYQVQIIRKVYSELGISYDSEIQANCQVIE